MEYSLIFQIAGIAFIVGLINEILKAANMKDYTTWITLVGFIIVLFIVSTKVSDLFDKIRSVFLFH